MKRSILSVCMLLALLCLLSCDINVLNDLLNEVRGKVLDESKDNKDLKHEQEDQAVGEERVGDIDVFEEEVDIQQDMELKPVNAGFEVSEQVYPYYPKEEVIKIEEKDLVPSTKEEKEAQAEIEKVKSALRDSGFQQLIEDALKLKSEYKQLEFSFYDTLSELKNKRENYSLKIRRENRAKKSSLTQLQNKLNDERSNLERFITEVEVGLNELESAKFLFEKAQKTLREAITKRLENEARKGKYYFFRRVDNGLILQLSRDSQRDARNSLNQLESSSGKIGGAMGIKKEIEEIINEAKSILGNLSR
ncbi:P12 family lipoprotein [Borrelia venezuelensis]|uniref:P12 family lipoprotein n=1 Tax=Borrelia venezuelensis TaxID=1653839 RepID=UPI001FF46A43|nr:P12 family lipoprotein [Borrelia venezuelensis]UPA12751.1 P12 family lipoprotein [Borrelia venezuelensis]UPA12787.1 P12 family lipoprotein [Borrelia venezuelensis]UPA12879.1 P12 family lipoprotein [Borrelia venezuelensis]